MKTTALLLVTFMYSSAFASSSLFDKISQLLGSLVNQSKQESTVKSSSSSSSSSKKSQQDVRYTLGLLKKISCTYHGYGTAVTGPNIDTIEFPETPESTVCDPLSNTATAQPTSGLLAKLILLPSDVNPKKVNTVMDYYNKGQKLDQNIYFADVNVPTRLFTDGFKNQAGEVLLDQNGNKLVENFALEYNSILKLSDNDDEGVYEFSLLSDDGARLFAKDAGVWKEIVNNDGNHATRLGCGHSTLTMTKSSEIPIKILYYQGPRYHIANVLLWRQKGEKKNLKEHAAHALCGVTGNNIFYSEKKDKTAAMKQLENSGWEVVANANFKMPEEKTNPCVEEQLQITDLAAVSVTAPTAVITWTTNINASSQLRITNFFTGEVILTTLDSNLVTNHEVHLDGLVRGLYYVIEAISVDAKGNSVTSPSITITP